MSTPRVHEEPEHIAITVNSPQESLATVLRGPTQDRERDLPPRPPPSASDADLLASDTQRVRSSPEPIVSATNTVPASPIQTPNRSAANLLHEERTPRRTATSPSRRVSIPPTVYDPDGFSGRYPTHTFNARPKSALVQSPNPNTSYSGMLAGNLSRRNTMLSEGVAPPPPRPIFPDEKKPPSEKTAGERLEPTLQVARRERAQFATKGRFHSIIINGAIALQVIAGALTTGVAAATTGRHTSIGVSILGGLSTVLASYLAKARGSGEPEHSQLRARELDTYIREVEAWVMDHGHKIGSEHTERINMFRDRFEQIVRTEGEASYTSLSMQSSTDPPHGHGSGPNNRDTMHGTIDGYEKV